LIDFEQDRFRHIMPHQLETGMIEQLHDVLAPTCKKVVEAENFVPIANQTVAKMRTKKSRAACDQNSHRPSKVPVGQRNCNQESFRKITDIADRVTTA
jgi:hypothetical protein